jgi:hypothetical protein
VFVTAFFYNLSSAHGKLRLIYRNDVQKKCEKNVRANQRSGKPRDPGLPSHISLEKMPKPALIASTPDSCVDSQPSGSTGPARRGLSRCVLICTLALTQLCTGCLSLSRRLPPVNVQAPGWTLRQGQAVWKLPGGHDIAGDVLVATGPANQSFVQFSKTPFPILIGQTSGHHWQVELPTQKKFYSGPGSPPKRLIWLYLPRALLGQALPARWEWKQTETNWRLENHKTGEAIDGFFAQ